MVTSSGAAAATGLKSINAAGSIRKNVQISAVMPPHNERVTRPLGDFAGRVTAALLLTSDR